MALINFKLLALNKVTPFESGTQTILHWFAMTDGDLWIELKGATIYEYTDDAIKSFGGKETKYNDYHIGRFIEDFTGIFEFISESVPTEIYNSLETFESFETLLNESEKWLEMSDDDDYDFYEHKYCNLISWLSSRSFDSAHLIGGPIIYFIRNNNKIKIIWDSQYKISNGQNMWTSPFGLIEMDYFDFINEIEKFGFDFFEAMNKQVQLALKTEFDQIHIDKVKLIEEQEWRKEDFFTKLEKLKKDSEKRTNWELVDTLTKEMKKNINII